MPSFSSVFWPWKNRGSETKETIEYTYTPRNANKDGQTLEINEKVSDKDCVSAPGPEPIGKHVRASLLDLPHGGLFLVFLREFSAEFTLVGDVLLVAGVTVEVVGYGAFDGKYIIETATHNLTGF